MNTYMIPLCALALVVNLAACFQYNGASSKGVLASINKRVITQNDFDVQRSQLAEFKAIDTESISAKKKLLDDMVFQELIFQEALKDSFHLKNMAIKQTVVDEFLKRKFKAEVEKINEPALRSYYQDNKLKLDQLRASHILIKFDEKDASTKLEALRQIKKIQKDLQDQKMTFEQAAQKFSQDSSAQKGGDLSYFTRGRMVKPFEKTVFELQKIGQVSDIVETQFGYHLIKLTDRKIGFAQHREKIRTHLIQRSILDETNKYKSELKAGNTVTVYHEHLQDDPGLAPEDKT